MLPNEYVLQKRISDWRKLAKTVLRKAKPNVYDSLGDPMTSISHDNTHFTHDQNITRTWHRILVIAALSERLEAMGFIHFRPSLKRHRPPRAMYSQLCHNPCPSVNPKMYELLQSMGYSRGHLQDHNQLGGPQKLLVITKYGLSQWWIMTELTVLANQS